MSLTNTYTFEEGTSGSNIVVGTTPGVTVITSTPKYASAAAVHGSMGCQCAAATGNSNPGIEYALPASSGRASWYGNGAVLGSGNVSFFQLLNASATFLTKIRINSTSGKLEILSGSNVVVGTSTTTASALASVVTRYDLTYTWSGSQLTITVELFIGANSEGTTPDETITSTAFAAATAPATLYLQASSTGYTFNFDTIRLYSSTSDTIAPFNPLSSGASGTASLILDASGAATGPGTTGTAALTLTAGGAAVPTAAGTASLTLAATGGATGTGTALSVDFNDGTTGAFSTVQGATVGPGFGLSGNGCRLSPAAGTNFATLSFNSTPAGHAWAIFEGDFRVVTKTTDPGATDFVNLFEIGNNVAVAPKGQMTVYTTGASAGGGAGDLVIDFNPADKTTVLPNYAAGVWHHVRAVVNYGATHYAVRLTLDGATTTMTSAGTQTPSTVGDLWVQYPSTATDQVVDWDNITYSVADADPDTASGGTATLTLTAGAAARASVVASASLTLTAAGASSGQASGGATLTLTASGADRASGAATATLTLVATSSTGSLAGGVAALALAAFAGAIATAGGTATITLAATGAATNPSTLRDLHVTAVTITIGNTWPATLTIEPVMEAP